MKTLFNRSRGFRGGDREKSQFAFFVACAVVLLAVAFVLGIQAGRIIEKRAQARRIEANKAGGPIEVRKESGAEIRKDLGVFSEEAGQVPAVRPPSADARLKETEKNVTFRDTLSGRASAPALIVKQPPRKKAPGAARAPHRSVHGKWLVQAGAFRERKAAEAFRRRLEKGGFRASIVEGKAGKAGRLYRVLVGPYGDRDAGNRAIRKLKTEWKVNAFPVNG